MFTKTGVKRKQYKPSQIPVSYNQAIHVCAINKIWQEPSLLWVSKRLQTFLVSPNSAPRHRITIQAASYNVIVIKLYARDCSVVTVKRLEMIKKKRTVGKCRQKMAEQTNTINKCQARENTLYFGLVSDWVKKSMQLL